MAAPKIPRKLRRDSTGRDVRALQRALTQAGYRKTKSGKFELTNTFGYYLEGSLKRFQKDRKLAVTGILDQKTFDALWPDYDPRARRFVQAVAKDRRDAEEEAADSNKEVNIRQSIVNAAYVGYRNRYAVHYTQDPRRWSGINLNKRPPRFPDYADCSSFVTWAYWLMFASGDDFINGAGWSAGYTGTQIARGRLIPRRSAQLGDLVFYGRSFWNIGHVAMYVGNGMVIGHGNESGPNLTSIDYRGDRQQIRSYV